MTDTRPDYTLDELKSYLPSGWDLIAGDPEWDAKKKRLVIHVIDNVDFDWPVAVSAKDVATHGRLEALERAMDHVFRDRLGKGTRGIGVSSQQ